MPTHLDFGGSLVGLLSERARQAPDRRAFVCLAEDNVETEVLTFSELDRRARIVAARILKRAERGNRVLLIFPTCLSFVVAFFGCLYAGAVAVPLVPPRGRRLRDSVLAIIRDCEPSMALTTVAYHGLISEQLAQNPDLQSICLLAVDGAFDEVADFVPREPFPDALAFLQYTSGSTSSPKGVMVTHRHVLANLEMMRIAFDNDENSTYVGWAPLFHDMGLIANVLEPFYIGALSILMAPAIFAQRPWLWLQAITRYGARVSGGPNFAYDHCIDYAERILRERGLDLSHWCIAFNSAEPVRPDTLDRFAQTFARIGFRPEAFYPCYGLADATLLVSAPVPLRAAKRKTISKRGLEDHRVAPPQNAHDEFRAVGCGQALRQEEIRIVDPDSRMPCAADSIGEIWVKGPHIPTGYWRKADRTREVFRATIVGVDGTFLRTGDLGFVDSEELYVTGRLDDLIIIRGRNYYPQDIEFVAEQAYPGLRRSASACFTLDGGQLVLVQEVQRVHRANMAARTAVAAIRQAVLEEFDLTLRAVLLVVPGAIPRTSSGKLRRSETRRQFLRGTLKTLVELTQIRGTPLRAVSPVDPD